MKILSQESETSRIVQKRAWPFFWEYIVARQRYNGKIWRITAWLFTNQKATVQDYIDWFDWRENTKKDSLGQKQF